jgi:hypothetical protein
MNPFKFRHQHPQLEHAHCTIAFPPGLNLYYLWFWRWGYGNSPAVAALLAQYLVIGEYSYEGRVVVEGVKYSVEAFSASFRTKKRERHQRNKRVMKKQTEEKRQKKRRKRGMAG